VFCLPLSSLLRRSAPVRSAGSRRAVGYIRSLSQPRTPVEVLDRGYADLLGLGIEEDGARTPKSFFLLGIGPFSEDSSFRHVVPLVYPPVWNLGTLRGDPHEGRQGVVLPVAPPPVP
jgi:hypothetical protein